MLRELEPDDYTPFLQELESADQSYFLEGGQSVNFWATYFRESGLAGEPLDEYRPFTSADCDIWVSEPTFRYLKQRHAGKLVIGSAPPDS